MTTETITAATNDLADRLRAIPEADSEIYRDMTAWDMATLLAYTRSAHLAALDQIAAITAENASLRAQLDRIDAAISRQLERSAAAYDAGMAEGLARYAKGPSE